ncbi:2399_t:CDS:2 [Dentiscutata heterogama]|uniref:2399_t:CDS:1 n=1 Tax=Dentiscutata heterogama TaxID=1316150 RepID=A0ACA9K502_9GLOM|nr:2399_t:CDS:2 [Dentiscutata heterogama]
MFLQQYEEESPKNAMNHLRKYWYQIWLIKKKQLMNKKHD